MMLRLTNFWMNKVGSNVVELRISTFYIDPDYLNEINNS